MQFNVIPCWALDLAAVEANRKLFANILHVYLPSYLSQETAKVPLQSYKSVALKLSTKSYFQITDTTLEKILIILV